MTISHKFIQLYGQMEEAYAACKSEIESIPKEVPDREKVLEKIVQESRSMCRNPMFKLGEITVEFTPAEREDHQQWVRKTEHWKGIQESPFCRRIVNKPDGYPGDFQLMNMIYRNALEGDTDWGKFIHRQALESETPQAVRNRRDFLREQILDLIRGGG